MEHFCSVFVSVLKTKLLETVTEQVKTIKRLVKVYLAAGVVQQLYLQGR